MDEGKVITSPIKAIKRFCFECNGKVRGEAEKCTSINCPLYNFREGNNPFRKKKEFSDERKAKMKTYLEKARAIKRGKDNEIDKTEN